MTACAPRRPRRRSSRALPARRLVVFEQSGHFAFAEENDQYLDALRDFLGRHTMAAG